MIATKEWVLMVNATITINGEHLIKSTWSSSENFDDCYRKIENYITKHKKEGDEVVKNINWTSQKEYPVTEW